MKEWPKEVVIDWLLENLGDPKQEKGKHGVEYRYNDFFDERDSQRKLSVNVGDRCGSWQGWKSGEHGDFVELVAQYHNVSRKRAFDLLITKYLGKIKPDAIDAKDEEPQEKKIAAPADDMLPIDSFILRKNNQFSRPYAAYLRKRGMTEEFIEKCYYSLATEYRRKSMNFGNYVIVPYYDQFNRIIYWTARAIWPNVEPRYCNQFEADAGNFLYGIDQVEGEVAIMTEAVFKAEKFPHQGVGTGGKLLTDEQIRQIVSKNFKMIVYVPDNEPYESRAAGRQNHKKKGSPAKAIENTKILRSKNQTVRIFDWTEFSKHHHIKGIKDIDDFKPGKKLSLSDIEPFLMDSLFEAEMKYRLNESI